MAGQVLPGDDPSYMCLSIVPPPYLAYQWSKLRCRPSTPYRRVAKRDELRRNRLLHRLHHLNVSDNEKRAGRQVIKSITRFITNRLKSR